MSSWDVKCEWVLPPQHKARPRLLLGQPGGLGNMEKCQNGRGNLDRFGDPFIEIRVALATDGVMMNNILQ